MISTETRRIQTLLASVKSDDVYFVILGLIRFFSEFANRRYRFDARIFDGLKKHS